MNEQGCRYGTHRVIEPKGTLPQPAIKLDNTPEIFDNEVLIDVQTLNIDSASYTQIKNACGGDAEKMKSMIISIVNERGKMQNPVTGSGGMLIGTVLAIGPKFPDKKLKVGDKIATLVSLSLTPLNLTKIIHLDPDLIRLMLKQRQFCLKAEFLQNCRTIFLKNWHWQHWMLQVLRLRLTGW